MRGPRLALNSSDVPSWHIWHWQCQCGRVDHWHLDSQLLASCEQYGTDVTDWVSRFKAPKAVLHGELIMSCYVVSVLELIWQVGCHLSLRLR